MARWADDLTLTPKQRTMLSTAFRDDLDTVLAHGPVRCGKSVGCLAAFFLYACRFEGEMFGLAAPIHKQVQNVLIEAASDLGVPIQPRDTYIEIPSLNPANPNKLLTFPIGRSDAWSKISGHTLRGLLVDECIGCDERAVDVLLERLSADNTRAWLLTNPGHPEHWYRKRFIEPAELGQTREVLNAPHTMDDAHFLSQKAKDRIHRRMKGIERQRRYYGLWVSSGLSIWPFIDELWVRSVPELDEFTHFDVAVDSASRTVTHALLYGHTEDRQIWMVDEWRHNAVERGPLRWEDQMSDITAKFRPWVLRKGYRAWVVDTNPSGFRKAAHKHLQHPRFEGHGGRVIPAYKTDVKTGCDAVEIWTSDRRVLVGPKAQHFRSESVGYELDPNAMAKGVWTPRKKNDHGPDAHRYYVSTCEKHSLVRSSVGRRFWADAEARSGRAA